LSGILYEQRFFSTATETTGRAYKQRHGGVSRIPIQVSAEASPIVYAYLVRHGEAVAQMDDPKRPLSLKGRGDVQRTAQLALQGDIQVSAIYHSGILRALETAQIMADILAPPLGLHLHSGLLPEDDPAIVKAELDLMEDPVAVVGHLPHLNRLAALLTSGDTKRAVVEFLPAMMIGFERQNQQWKIIWRSDEPTI
jgi:phosphohistidine phosphatase